MATEKIARYKKQWRIPSELSEAIVQDPLFAVFFENTVKLVGSKDALLAAKWFAGELKKTLNYNDLRIQETELTNKTVSDLIKMIKAEKVTDRAAEFVLRDMVSSGDDADIIIKRKEMGMLSDDSAINDTIEKTLTEQSKAVLDFKSGRRPEAFEFLVGHIMKATQGRADPAKIREILKKKI